jgi:hypothetical protein
MIGSAIVPAIKGIEQKWTYLIVIFGSLIAWGNFFVQIPDVNELPNIVVEWIIACIMIILLCLYHSCMQKYFDHMAFRYENPLRKKAELEEQEKE